MKCGFGKSEGKMAEYTHTPTSAHPMHTPTYTRENDETRGAGGKGGEANWPPMVSATAGGLVDVHSLCCWEVGELVC